LVEEEEHNNEKRQTLISSEHSNINYKLNVSNELRSSDT